LVEPISPPGWREQRRSETTGRIVEAARQIAATGSPLTLTAVAKRLSMATSALYRYVESSDDLERLVVEACYVDLMTDLDAAPASSDAGERLLSILVTLRRWALAHPKEFHFVFTPVNRSLDLDVDGHRVPAALQFTTRLILATHELMTQQPDGLGWRPMATSRAERKAVATLAETMPAAEKVRGIPLDTRWTCWFGWTLVCGTLSLETSAQLPDALIADGLVFRRCVRELNRLMGLDAKAAERFDRRLAKALEAG
jgi:AcrR family transcriptional regulator